MMRYFTYSLAAILVAGCTSEPTIDMSIPVAVEHGAEPMRLGEILGSHPKQKPADLIVFPENKNCKMLRARGGAIVANVTSSEGGKPRSPLYFVSDRYQKPQDEAPYYSLEKARVTDVVVTKTDAPVSLLLTSYNPTLWVIHSAENVKIDTINIMSFEGAALIAPQVDKRYVNFLISNQDNEKCRKKPLGYRDKDTPQSYGEARLAKRIERRGRKSKYSKEGKIKAYREWLNWVAKKIGRVDVAIDREYRVESALIGLPPDQVVPATAVGGEVLIGPSHADVFWGSKKQAKKKFPPRPK